MMEKKQCKQSLYTMRVLRDYRKAYHLSQKALAYDQNIEPQTLRSYDENRGRVLENVNEFRHSAGRLALEPEQLSITTPAADMPHSLEEINATVQYIWHLVENSRVHDATRIIVPLTRSLERQLTHEAPDLLRGLAHVYHVAGYATAVGTRAYEAHKAIPYYHKVESIGRLLDDPTLVNIGLTYQGDMHQRVGNVQTAITFLEAARDTAGADVAARGNGLQLLGRAYLRKHDINSFERAMAESEELTAQFDSADSSTQGHYNLGTVYEEYGRSYADLGRIDQAFDYLNRAQHALPATEFWNQLIITAKAIALVKGGEIHAGIEMAVKVAEQCFATGNIRYLDRIFVIQQHLAQLTCDTTLLSTPLREVLDGGI